MKCNAHVEIKGGGGRTAFITSNHATIDMVLSLTAVATVPICVFLEKQQKKKTMGLGFNSALDFGLPADWIGSDEKYFHCCCTYCVHASRS